MLNKNILMTLMTLMLGMCYSPGSVTDKPEQFGFYGTPDATRSIVWLNLQSSDSGAIALNADGYYFFQKNQDIFLVTNGKTKGEKKYYKILNVGMPKTKNRLIKKSIEFNDGKQNYTIDSGQMNYNFYSSNYSGTPMSFIAQETDKDGTPILNGSGYKLIYVSPKYNAIDRRYLPEYLKGAYTFLELNINTYYFILVDLDTKDLKLIYDTLNQTGNKYKSSLSNGLNIKLYNSGWTGDYILVTGVPALNKYQGRVQNQTDSQQTLQGMPSSTMQPEEQIYIKNQETQTDQSFNNAGKTENQETQMDESSNNAGKTESVFNNNNDTNSVQVETNLRTPANTNTDLGMMNIGPNSSSDKKDEFNNSKGSMDNNMNQPLPEDTGSNTENLTNITNPGNLGTKGENNA